MHGCTAVARCHRSADSLAPVCRAVLSGHCIGLCRATERQTGTVTAYRPQLAWQCLTATLTLPHPLAHPTYPSRSPHGMGAPTLLAAIPEAGGGAPGHGRGVTGTQGRVGARGAHGRRQAAGGRSARRRRVPELCGGPYVRGVRAGGEEGEAGLCCAELCCAVLC